MNNSGVPLGPAPAAGPERRRPLTESQAATLDVLRRRRHPVRIADVAATLGLHVNTVREHLDALVDAGLATRVRDRATGRGRPAWLYDAVADPEPDVRLRDYAGLALALAGHLRDTGDDPAGTSLAIGRRWGRDLAEQELLQTDSRPPRARVLELLDGLGFAPDASGTSVRLRRCPLLDAARRYPEVICRVHLGLVRGTLEELGVDASGTELTAFAEPGACILEFDSARGSEGGRDDR